MSAYEKYPINIRDDLVDDILGKDSKKIMDAFLICRQNNVAFADISNFRIREESAVPEPVDESDSFEESDNCDSEVEDEPVESEIEEEEVEPEYTYGSTPNINDKLSEDNVLKNIEEENRQLRSTLFEKNMKTNNMEKFYNEIVNNNSKQKLYILERSKKHANIRLTIADLNTLSEEELSTLYQCIYDLEQKLKNYDFVENIIRMALKFVESELIGRFSGLKYLKGISNIDKSNLAVTKEYISQKTNINNNTPFIDIILHIATTALQNYCVSSID